jgi:hypothetical protein
MSTSASSGPSPLSETSSRGIGMRLNSLAGQLSQVPPAPSIALPFFVKIDFLDFHYFTQHGRSCDLGAQWYHSLTDDCLRARLSTFRRSRC